jgi:hypothetical protein
LFPDLRGLFLVLLIALAGLVSLGFLWVVDDLQDHKKKEAREATTCFYSGEPLEADCIRDEEQGIAYNRREVYRFDYYYCPYCKKETLHNVFIDNHYEHWFCEECGKRNFGAVQISRREE